MRLFSNTQGKSKNQPAPFGCAPHNLVAAQWANAADANELINKNATGKTPSAQGFRIMNARTKALILFLIFEESIITVKGVSNLW